MVHSESADVIEMLRERFRKMVRAGALSFHPSGLRFAVRAGL